MEGTEITLEQIMQHRENRVSKQKELIDRFNCTVCTFTMNIAGPIKTNPDIRKAFDEGFELFRKKIQDNGYDILYSETEHLLTGDQGFLVTSGQSEAIKDLAMEIENEGEIGRLYDIDVINSQGEKLSRPQYRKCLICDNQAQICARQRTHSVEELQKATERILKKI